MSRVWNVAHDTDARRRVFLLDATYSGPIGTPTLAAIDGRQRLRPGSLRDGHAGSDDERPAKRGRRVSWC
jgi:hypothetical protein